MPADSREHTQKQYKRYGAFDFAVLSDPDKKVARAYGVYWPAKDGQGEGDLLHGTFVITRQGKVAWVNAGDEPFTEDRTLLREIARAEGRKVGP